MKVSSFIALLSICYTILYLQIKPPLTITETSSLSAEFTDVSLKSKALFCAIVIRPKAKVSSVLSGCGYGKV